MRRAFTAVVAIACLLTLSGAKGCANEGQTPGAHASTHADAQHPPQPGQRPASPAPHPDPFLIDRAKDDPNLALLELSFHASRPGAIRTFAVRWYAQAPTSTTKVIVQGSRDVENHWDLVLYNVQGGQRVGFTAQPEPNSFDGYAQCGVWHQGLKGLTGNGAGQRGGCGVSYTIGT